MFEDARLYTKEYQNGLLLSKMGAFLTSDTSIEFIPSFQLGTAQVLGREGSILCSRTLGTRILRLMIHFSTEMLPDFSPFKYLSLDELDDLLSRIMLNHYQPIEVEFTDLPNRFYKASFDSGQTPKFYIADGSVGYTLICHDPYVYGTHNKYTLSSGSTLACDLEDSGENVYPTLTITGCSSSLTIYIDGSVACQLKVPYSGSTVYFKPETLEIEDSRGTNLYPYIQQGDFPQLPAKKVSNLRIVGGTFTAEFRSKSLF